MFDALTAELIHPELLVDPIEEELTFNKKLSESDRKIYEQTLKILNKEGDLKTEAREEIQILLSQV